MHAWPFELSVQSAQVPEYPQAVGASPAVQFPPEQQKPPLHRPFPSAPHPAAQVPPAQVGVLAAQAAHRSPDAPQDAFAVPATQDPLEKHPRQISRAVAPGGSMLRATMAVSKLKPVEGSRATVLPTRSP